MAKTELSDDFPASILKAYVEAKNLVNSAAKLTGIVVSEATKQAKFEAPGPIIVEPIVEDDWEQDWTDEVIVKDKVVTAVEATELRTLLLKVQEIVEEMDEEPSSINISMLWEEGFIYGYEAILI